MEFRDNALSFEPFWIPEGCPHIIRTGAPGKKKNWGFSNQRISRPPSWEGLKVPVVKKWAYLRYSSTFSAVMET